MNSTSNTASSKLIVLIDDESSVLLALRLLLGALGYQVKDFSKPREAVAYLKEGGLCDIILSDLRMPDLDGIEVLAEVRKFLPSTPFILISGHATEEDVVRAKNKGATGFLGKPFTPDQLKSKIDSLF